PQQQQTGIGRLVAAVKIYCEFLAADTWKVEGKRRIVGHGGCGARLIRDALVSTPVCYVNRSLCATAATEFSRVVHNPETSHLEGLRCQNPIRRIYFVVLMQRPRPSP